MNKRQFLKTGLYSAGALSLSGLLTSCAKNAGKKGAAAGNRDFSSYSVGKVNKREKVLAVLDRSKPNAYVPAAFFMHFADKLGAGAVKSHIEFFRATNMDFSKVQYEVTLPKQPEIKTPKDWDKIKVYGQELFEPQFEVIRQIVKELKNEVLIIPTVYSPLLLAEQVVGQENIVAHIKENPDAVAKGFARLAENIVYYIRESAKIGVDGFYLSTHGGDKALFYNTPTFDKVIRPFDEIIFNEATSISQFNILHICSPENTYQELDHLTAYPSSVINPPVILNDGSKTDLKDVERLFNRPVMSGLDHHGVIAHGSADDIRREIDEVFRNNAPQNFIFAANCTVPSDTSWQNLRAAIDYAHDWRINNE
jgi:uroporphyrinogen decarboxylase